MLKALFFFSGTYFLTIIILLARIDSAERGGLGEAGAYAPRAPPRDAAPRRNFPSSRLCRALPPPRRSSCLCRCRRRRPPAPVRRRGGRSAVSSGSGSGFACGHVLEADYHVELVRDAEVLGGVARELPVRDEPRLLRPRREGPSSVGIVSGKRRSILRSSPRNFSRYFRKPVLAELAPVHLPAVYYRKSYRRHDCLARHWAQPLELRELVRAVGYAPSCCLRASCRNQKARLLFRSSLPLP